jgi:hypothetical protein
MQWQPFIDVAKRNSIFSGVADPPVCSPEERSIDHAVLLVRFACLVDAALILLGA